MNPIIKTHAQTSNLKISIIKGTYVQEISIFIFISNNI